MVDFKFCSGLMWHAVKPDTYVQFNDSDMFDYDIYSMPDGLSDILYDYFHHKAYLTALAKCCINVCEELFEEFDLQFDRQTLEVSSPQYYNYSTDDLSVKCSMADEKFEYLESLAYVSKRIEFASYLEKFNSSRDGFCSFMPNTIIDVKAEKDNDFDRYVAILLDFYLYSTFDKDELKDYDYHVADNLVSNYSFTEFIDPMETIVSTIAKKTKVDRIADYYQSQLETLRNIVKENIDNEKNLESFVYDIIVEIDEELKKIHN